MIVTYYLAIENIPSLKEVFPSFVIYLVFMAGIGIPLLVAVGYAHFKRIPAYQSETDIAIESSPYYYKVPPGYWIEVFIPLYLSLSKQLVKISKNEKLTDKELEEIENIQKKLDILSKGGYIGKPKFIKDKK